MCEYIRILGGIHMKKRSLILVIILLTLLMVGCSFERVKSASSLRDGYFEISRKIDSGDKITESYVKKILVGYDCEKGEEFRMEKQNIDGSDYVQRPYIYKDGNETLTVTYSNENGQDIVQPLYEVKDDKGSISIAYTPINPDEIYNVDGVEQKPSLMFIVTRNNIKSYEKICKLLDNEYDDYEKKYHKISQNIATSNDLTISDVEKLLGFKPVVDEYKLNEDKSLNVISYFFEKGKAGIGVDFIKEKNKFWQVSYTDNEKFTIKTTIDKDLINKSNKLHTGIATYVESIDDQERLLNEIMK
jgi:hypothetical protein